MTMEAIQLAPVEIPAADPYRIIVAGSLGWTDWAAVAWHLATAIAQARAEGREPVVVHGCHFKTAELIAEHLCHRYGVRVEHHRPPRKNTQMRAEYQNNARIVDHGGDVCLAFLLPCTGPACKRPGPHDSHTAGHLAEEAVRGGIPVVRVQGRR